MEEILHTLVFLFDFHAVAQGPAVVLKRPSTAQSCCGQKFSARGESLVQFVPVVLKTRGGSHHCSNRVSQGGLTLQLTLRATQKRTFCAVARIRSTSAKTRYYCKITSSYFYYNSTNFLFRKPILPVYLHISSTHSTK